MGVVLPSLLQLSRGRTALIAAHPDDETIGAGGHLPAMSNAIVLMVTDGSPVDPADRHAVRCSTRSEYAALRRCELVSAMALAGIAEERLECLGIGDQQASSDLAGLAWRLAGWMREQGASLVLTHPFEMGHPDHDAVAFAVHAAAALIAREGGDAPRLVEFTSYHRGPHGEIVTGAFAPGGDPGESFRLSAAAQARKRDMLGCYASQAGTLAPFGCEIERFRPAPSYVFTSPPHSQGAYYDRFEWGMRSERWLALSAGALEALGLRSC